jgi:hypothetical protein
MSMDKLRRTAQTITEKNKGQKRSGKSAYFLRWKPPQVSASAGTGNAKVSANLRNFLAAPPSEEAELEVSEPIVLVKGSYSDPYAVDENGNRDMNSTSEGLHLKVHTFSVYIKPSKPGQNGFNTFRELVCSSGPEPHAPQPCVGCYMVDHGAKDSKPKDNWAFNIAHLGVYHLKPLVKDGQVQMKKDGSGPILIKEECISYKMDNVALGRGVTSGKIKDQKLINKYKTCESCKEQHPFTWGDHRIMQLGMKHLRNLFEIDEMVGSKCANCETTILRVGFDCSGCGAELVDLSKVQWTNDEIDDYAARGQCGSCDSRAVVKYRCGYNDKFKVVQEPCNSPRRTDIFDCVLWIQRQGESTESEIVVKRVELIKNYKSPEGKPLTDCLAEIVKEPFDLVEMYKPETVENQSELIQVQNPYANAQTQYTNYPGTENTGTPVFPGRPNFGK